MKRASITQLSCAHAVDVLIKSFKMFLPENDDYIISVLTILKAHEIDAVSGFSC